MKLTETDFFRKLTEWKYLPTINFHSQNCERIINKKRKEVIRFKISMNNFNLKSRFYDERFKKFNMKYNSFKYIHKISDTFDSLVIIRSTSASLTLNKTVFGKNVVLITVCDRGSVELSPN